MNGYTEYQENAIILYRNPESKDKLLLMRNPLYRFKNYIEWQAFGVCSAIGDKLGIATSRIRLWFIYISFLTLGSPLIIYMILAFWMNIRNYIWLNRRNPLRWR